MLRLVETSRENQLYKEIRDRHYVKNSGCIGKQIHYLIFDSEEFGAKPIGIITGASAVWACKARDDFFGITTENRIGIIDKIIDNTVFRLEKNEKNLASKILSIWRKQVVVDWKRKYGTEVIGFETFVFGESRNGCIYKADNWKYVGETKGAAKYHPHGMYGGSPRRKTEIKKIFCKLFRK